MGTANRVVSPCDGNKQNQDQSQTTPHSDTNDLFERQNCGRGWFSANCLHISHFKTKSCVLITTSLEEEVI